MKITYGMVLWAAGLSLLNGCGSAPHKTASTATRSEECHATTEREIAGLFDRWNRSLQTGNAHLVVANYAERSILLATLSNKPRITAAEKEDYFQHFLEDQPSGKIDFSFIEIGCNSAFDAGLYTFFFRRTGTTVAARYTFTYAWDGRQWLITSHHSSLMPEGNH
jgi:hypothetical protein